MLKSITINNYKTFVKETTFDFSATKYTFLEKENIGADKVLKGALLVGENASGKTSALQAILFLLQILFGVNLVEFIKLRSFYTSKKSFTITYVFSIDHKEIKYTVTSDDKGFREEELSIGDALYFSRRGTSAIVYTGDEPHFRSQLPQNLLFLRNLYFSTGFADSHTLVHWLNFLQRSVYVNCLKNTFEGNPIVVETVASNAYFDKAGTKAINHFLTKIGYHQQVFYSNNIKNENSSFSSDNKFLSFEKSGTNTKIPLSLESTGNKALISILPTIMHAAENDCIIIVDEFSSGLHNELEECLLKYFFTKSHNSQIFFTTHSTNVLNTRILRPDQIYSVKFDGKNGTSIKRFSEREPLPRMAQNLEHMYLNGEFDGKPYYSSDFEA